MKTTSTTNGQRGSALLIVMLLGALSLFILASTLQRTAATGKMTDEAIRYSVAVSAAEAATEKVISEMSADFAKLGEPEVKAKNSTYKIRIPKPAENGHWNKFKFSNGKGNQDETSVEMIVPWATSSLTSQYQGMQGYAATYRILSNARDVAAKRFLAGGVCQDIQLALIPIFQFSIFYNMDMEISPGATMNIGGRVHGNNDIFISPNGVTLTFFGDVTGAGQIYQSKKPGDPSSRSKGTTIFRGEHDSGVMTLNLPIGTNNSPAAVREIVEVPPANESANSTLGKERFYNKADLVILVGDNKVDVRGGGGNNGNGANLQWSSVSNFVSINKTFYDTREQKTVNVTEIDVAGFNTWNATADNPLKNSLKRDVSSIYVDDQRTVNANSMNGVRLANGDTLPPLGLTVATPDPIYVMGNYNATGSAVGTSDTSGSKPASLIGDSITILSGNWKDANSTKDLGSRTPTATTVNSAFLAGIVPTGNGYYSGGVENFPRFLENWNGTMFTYNGSMIVMFKSKYATTSWNKNSGVYSPPKRNWYFDSNFLDPTKLPPLCPSVRAIIRGQWTLVSASE